MPKNPTKLRRSAKALYATGHPRIATRFMREAKKLEGKRKR